MAGIQPNSGVPAEQAQNSLLAPTLGPTCANLWYAPRCTPRLDPAAMNAMIAEIINFVNCAGLTYDCTRLDNMCLAIKDIFCDLMTANPFSCTFPVVADACALEQIVLQTDAAGNKRFARLTPGSRQIATGNLTNVYGVNFPPTLFPQQPGNPATFYNIPDLAQDQDSGTINETKLQFNAVASGQFTLACAAVVDLTVRAAQLNFSPAGTPSVGAMAIRVDGQFLVNNGQVTRSDTYTNFQSSIETTLQIPLSAGSHTIILYAIAESSNRPPAQIVGQSAGTPGSGSVSFTVNLSLN